MYVSECVSEEKREKRRRDRMISLIMHVEKKDVSLSLLGFDQSEKLLSFFLPFFCFRRLNEIGYTHGHRETRTRTKI